MPLLPEGGNFFHRKEQTSDRGSESCRHTHTHTARDKVPFISAVPEPCEARKEPPAMMVRSQAVATMLLLLLLLLLLLVVMVGIGISGGVLRLQLLLA